MEEYTAMLEIASASLNTLPYPAVSPTENTILNRLLEELQSLRSEVQELREENQDLIKKASQPLQDEVSNLKAIIARQDEKIAALEATQDHQAENELIQLRLIKGIQDEIHKRPQPMQKDRGEILRALIAANGGKMLLKDARKKMHLIKPRFSELLSTMQDDIEVKPYHLRKNQKVLVLK
jgi:chromosome segregation ATPase